MNVDGGGGYVFFFPSPGSADSTVCLKGREQVVICAELAITSRSHADAARHGVQLIPLQERGGAHWNERHMTNLPAGRRWGGGGFNPTNDSTPTSNEVKMSK